MPPELDSKMSHHTLAWSILAVLFAAALMLGAWVIGYNLGYQAGVADQTSIGSVPYPNPSDFLTHPCIGAPCLPTDH